MHTYEDVRVGGVDNEIRFYFLQRAHAGYCGKVSREDAHPSVQEGADGAGGKGQTGHSVAWPFLCHPAQDSVHVRLQRRGYPALSHTMNGAESSMGAGSSICPMLRL